MPNNNFLQSSRQAQKIDNIISRPDLLEKIREDFNLGNYETTVSKAFKFLERSYISSALKSNEIFDSSNKEYLNLLDEKQTSELKTLNLKMLGAMYWIRNFNSAKDDSQYAAQHVLAYVDLQLKLINQQKN